MTVARHAALTQRPSATPSTVDGERAIAAAEPSTVRFGRWWCVLSLEVHKELAALIAAVNRLTAAATDRAPFAEIELRVAAVRDSEARLKRATGATAFGNLGRHVAWLEKRHREGSPALSDGDVTDLLHHDLPEAVAVVEKWAAQILDEELVAAITQTWEAQDYDGAIRDAFNELERRMKALTGGTDFRAPARRSPS